MSSPRNDSNTLENIASDLRALADDLAQGKLRVGNRLVEVGNPLFIKTKQKITGDTAYCTLSFQVPLRELNKEPAPTTGQRYSPEKNQEPRDDRELRLKGRPPEGKKIKKEMSSLWKTVSKKLEQGQAPTPAEEKSLISAFENYTVFSESTWHEEWLACFAVLREALACARKGDLRAAQEQAAKVNDLTKACHKKHK
jgi:XXXCH domain-containing protein